MSWRDNPEIIWQDRQGDRLEHGKAFFSGHVLQVREGRDHRAVCMPESVADRVEATERWLAALGLTADNIREKPRPLAEGDRVVDDIGDVGKVLGGPWDIGGDALVAIWWDHDLGVEVVHVDTLHRAEPEPESEWVITRDPRVLAAARDAGRIIQWGGVGRWVDSATSAADFRRRRSIPLSIDYRYEGPVIEAPVDRCTPDNRTCDHDGPLCNEPVDGYCVEDEGVWLCSRLSGHEGPHIPCAGAMGHNLHPRPEDR